VLGALRDGTYRDDVAADIAQANAYGIRGVPFFVIDGRYGVSGAQDAQLFAEALSRAADEIEVRA
jgi:predicted DsbA family dithiol-disulfide isomerase